MNDMQVPVYDVMRMRVVLNMETGQWVDEPPQCYPGATYIAPGPAHQLAQDLNYTDVMKARLILERGGNTLDMKEFDYYYVRARPAVGRELAVLLRSVFVELVARGAK